MPILEKEYFTGNADLTRARTRDSWPVIIGSGESAAMASVSSSPPSPSPEAPESTALARGLAAVVLLALLVVPLGAIAIGIVWLWSENANRATFSTLGAVVTDVPA